MNISLDSNALTYLIEAIDPDYDPLNDQQSNCLQRVSMIRIFLYGGLRCGILPQVSKELGDIPKEKWRKTHESTAGVLFHEVISNWSRNDLMMREEILLKAHPKEKDCTLLAEAEFAGINVLLTRDEQFRNRLNPLSSVEIIFPSDFLESMNIQKNTEPKFCPLESNPLSGKSWWKIQ